MNKEELFDNFMSRAKQDIKICENEHELQMYIAELLENIDYWKNEYDYMKKHINILQQENKQLKERIDTAIEYCEKELESIDEYFENTDDSDLRNIRNILKGEYK